MLWVFIFLVRAQGIIFVHILFWSVEIKSGISGQTLNYSPLLSNAVPLILYFFGYKTEFFPSKTIPKI